MSTVRIDDREGGVRLLTLDRPPANAIEETLLADLSAALQEVQANDAVRAMVITGAGRFFSAGLDLRAQRGDDEFARMLLEQYRDAHVRLLALPKPTITMLNGHAIAGGLVLALACDYRLGLDADYRIGLNEVAIGAAFPKIAFETVRLRLDHAQASELLLRAEIYPASEALRLGVVHELLPAATFEETVLRRAARLAAYPKEAYAHTKTALVAETVARVEAESREDAARGVAVWMTPESLAARGAQQEKLGKRPPVERKGA